MAGMLGGKRRSRVPRQKSRFDEDSSWVYFNPHMYCLAGASHTCTHTPGPMSHLVTHSLSIFRAAIEGPASTEEPVHTHTPGSTSWQNCATSLRHASAKMTSLRKSRTCGRGA
eukprot:114305-Chlamydomonas_euryale.AAC.1